MSDDQKKEIDKDFARRGAVIVFCAGTIAVLVSITAAFGPLAFSMALGTLTMIFGALAFWSTL